MGVEKPSNPKYHIPLSQPCSNDILLCLCLSTWKVQNSITHLWNPVKAQSVVLKFSVPTSELWIISYPERHHQNFSHTMTSVSAFLQLSFKWPMFGYANICEKITLESHFIYLGNKEIGCIFKTYCITSVLFSKKFHLFRNFIFSLQIKFTMFINQVLKFKYQLNCLKVKDWIISVVNFRSPSQTSRC